MSNSEFSPWVDLLIGIIQQAQRDAAGQLLATPKMEREIVQREARHWLETELDSWAEWAGGDANKC